MNRSVHYAVILLTGFIINDVDNGALRSVMDIADVLSGSRYSTVMIAFCCYG